MSCGRFWSQPPPKRITTLKKLETIHAARHRETEAALDLIRQKVQTGSLDLAWIERTLRDAALRDTARLLESFLNHELPHLLGEPQRQKDECFHSHQTRQVSTVLGPITLRRAYYRGSQGGRYPLDDALGLHDQYTPAVLQLMCWAGAMDSSFELASETLSRFAGPGHSRPSSATGGQRLWPTSGRLDAHAPERDSTSACRGS